LRSPTEEEDGCPERYADANLVACMSDAIEEAATDASCSWLARLPAS